MTKPADPTRNQARAARLRQEAANCLMFAVSERDQDYAAQLIDEAIRLERRSGELIEGSDR